MRILVGEVMDFESLDQFVHLRVIEKDRRHYHKRRRLFGNSLGCVHSGQQTRLEEVREVPIEQRECEITCGNQSQQDCCEKESPICFVCIDVMKQWRQDQQRQKRQRSDICRSGMSEEKAAQSLLLSWLIIETRLQQTQTGIDEVVADVFFGALLFSICCKLDSCFGDLDLACTRPLADSFDDMSITVT